MGQLLLKRTTSNMKLFIEAIIGLAFVHKAEFTQEGECQRPSYGCTDEGDIYKSVDCDDDGILDHACHNTINYNRWLILSSEGCPNSWGSTSRPGSACPEAFGDTCWRPIAGCTDFGDVYKSVDCDGDGILDHTCTNTINYNRWLVLSSEGCPDSWGQLDRPVSACPQAFGDSGCLNGGWDCCTSSNQCSIGEGDCDYDFECSGNLVCGTDNCGSNFQNGTNEQGEFHQQDCCTQATQGTTTPTTITTTPTTTPAGCEDNWPTKKCSKKCNAKKCLKSKSCKKNCKNTCDLCGIEEPCEDQKSSKFCKKQLKKGKCSQSSVWKKCKKTCDAC